MKKSRKAWLVEMYHQRDGNWYPRGSYRTKEQAEHYALKQSRKIPARFRVLKNRSCA